MKPSPPPIRHCPLCGIAMQARKSRESQVKFDIFECLTCRTVISETKHTPPADTR